MRSLGQSVLLHGECSLFKDYTGYTWTESPGQAPISHSMLCLELLTTESDLKTSTNIYMCTVLIYICVYIYVKYSTVP